MPTRLPVYGYTRAGLSCGTFLLTQLEPIQRPSESRRSGADLTTLYLPEYR